MRFANSRLGNGGSHQPSRALKFDAFRQLEGDGCFFRVCRSFRERSVGFVCWIETRNRKVKHDLVEVMSTPLAARLIRSPFGTTLFVASSRLVSA